MMTQLYDRNLGRFVKAIRPDGSIDSTIDSSLSFTFLYGTFDAENAAVNQTMKAIADKLWISTGIGGLARYENDAYHRVSSDVQGNPWFICTLWLARWHVASAKSPEDLKKALSLFLWVVKHSRASGVLAEQLNPYDATPISVSPLVWSHAEYVLAVSEYIEKYRLLSST
jgi:GH15 family glucan-1,4-alpha-glucosidase